MARQYRYVGASAVGLALLLASPASSLAQRGVGLVTPGANPSGQPPGSAGNPGQGTQPSAAPIGAGQGQPSLMGRGSLGMDEIARFRSAATGGYNPGMGGYNPGLGGYNATVLGYNPLMLGIPGNGLGTGQPNGTGGGALRMDEIARYRSAVTGGSNATVLGYNPLMPGIPGNGFGTGQPNGIGGGALRMDEIARFRGAATGGYNPALAGNGMPNYFNPLGAFGYGLGAVGYPGIGSPGMGSPGQGDNSAGVSQGNPSSGSVFPGGGVAGISAPLTSPAVLDVRAPANARVFVQGQPVSQSGGTYRFVTPLNPDTVQDFEVQAVWNHNGQDMTATQHIILRPGDHQGLLFMGGQPVASSGSTGSNGR